MVQSCVQLGYTLVFGAYASYILARTGSIVDCGIVHSFANYCGFPSDFDWWSYGDTRERVRGVFAYVGGFVGFLVLLYNL
jgi:prenyl protein peptidase